MKPDIHPSAFIAPTAQIWGDVSIGAGSSVWFGAVLRGDEGKVVIGEGSHVQDNCVVHSDLGNPVQIGSGVTIGHGAVIRACRIGDGAMIGMNATVMSGVTIGARCVVGAHSLVPYGREFGDGLLILGVPARAERAATSAEQRYSEIACQVYAGLAADYAAGRIEPHARPGRLQP